MTVVTPRPTATGRAMATLLALAVPTSAPAAQPTPEVVAARLLAEETVSQGAWRKLAWLSDRIGHRLAGSEAAARAVAWSAEELRRDGLENVRTEPVWVPRWVRGEQHFEITAPIQRPMVGLSLGNSVGTGPEGVSGRVIPVASLEELERRAAEVADAVVFYNKPIVANGGAEDGYGAGSKLRYSGNPAASRLGARAMIIRSLGTATLRTPHTGSTGREDGVEPIPGAAITIEDAGLLERLLASGEPVEVCLRMGARMLPDVLSANVVGELVGRERPEEIVVIGGHLDSWDVGQGAIDDGAGVVAAMEALRLLKVLGLRPRRTIRAVLFMNEENGLRGGQAYARDHAAELDRHVAAIESDAGAGQPIGFPLDAGPGARERFAALLSPLSGLGCARVLDTGGTGADISPLEPSGVPLIGLQQDMTRYFDWHHTEADTLDKVVPAELTANVVAMAYVAWALAEAETPLPRAVRPASRRY